jgi:hypothetical protein
MKHCCEDMEFFLGENKVAIGYLLDKPHSLLNMALLRTRRTTFTVPGSSIYKALVDPAIVSQKVTLPY